MSESEPVIEPMPIKRRRRVFLLTLTVFVIAVPLFVFYAIGYRYDFGDDVRIIRAVGGMYISARAEDVSIYVDEEPVENMRIFQNAAYVQNLDAGLHQVHVQGADITTWVKVLPVSAHFVTEADSFNLPERPQIRLLTPYQDSSGVGLVAPGATSSFTFASTTNALIATSSLATSTVQRNPEYTYISQLIASTTAERAALRAQEARAAERFRFGTGSSTVATTSLATTTKDFRGVRLLEAGDDVIAQWVGVPDRIPYYYCVTYRGEAATALGYGSHVMSDLKAEYGTGTDFTDPDLIDQRLCRDSIRVDRKWQSVQHFDFLPGSEHHVVMQLQDGVYIVEIDDRAWQNVQLLYPGDYLEVLIEGGRIFIQDGEYILEVLTELP